jgi:hypothetical protein
MACDPPLLAQQLPVAGRDGVAPSLVLPFTSRGVFRSTNEPFADGMLTMDERSDWQMLHLALTHSLMLGPRLILN